MEVSCAEHFTIFQAGEAGSLGWKAGRQSGRQYMYICATFTLSQSMFYYQHICPTITGVLTWSMLVCLYIASTKEWVHLWDRKTFFAIFL